MNLWQIARSLIPFGQAAMESPELQKALGKLRGKDDPEASDEDLAKASGQISQVLSTINQVLNAMGNRTAASSMGSRKGVQEFVTKSVDETIRKTTEVLKQSGEIVNAVAYAQPRPPVQSSVIPGSGIPPVRQAPPSASAGSPPVQQQAPASVAQTLGVQVVAAGVQKALASAGNAVAGAGGGGGGILGGLGKMMGGAAGGGAGAAAGGMTMASLLTPAIIGAVAAIVAERMISIGTSPFRAAMGVAKGASSPAAKQALGGLAGEAGQAFKSLVTLRPEDLMVQLAELPFKLEAWGMGLVESQRHLADFNGALAGAYAEFDVRSMRRDIQSAAATEGSTSEFMEALADLQDELQPIKDIFTNIALNVLTAVTKIATLIAKIERYTFELASWFTGFGWGGNTDPKEVELPAMVELAEQMSRQFERDMERERRRKRRPR